jgi:potassium/hydrogen antiporter
MYDGLAWLMQIILFLTLGLLVFPSHIIPFIGIGLIISFFLIIVARPLSVFISLLPFKLLRRERWFISWVGLRGAVPIVFATYPLIAGLEKADTIFNIVFFISLTSVLIQGTTIPFFAKLFHVALPAKTKPLTPTDIILGDGIKSEMLEVVIPENSPATGKKIIDLNFPRNALIVVIHRGDNFITPDGSTEIKALDRLFVIYANRNVLPQLLNSLGISEENINP